MTDGIRVIITGATGMVGEGVLDVCLKDDRVAEVLVLGRRSCGYQHSKLKEIVHNDLHDLSSISTQFAGYDACYFCLGTTSVGKKEAEYYRITYMLTMHVAETLCRVNKNMVFCYVSGAGTDSSEQGRVNWARVKGKTENDLQKLRFNKVFNFRPGALEPTPGLRNTLGMYKWLGWLVPIFRVLAPNSLTKLSELGRSMILVTLEGYPKSVLEVRDIKLTSK